MRKSFAFLLAGLISCGGTTKEPVGPTGSGSGGGAAKPSGPGDVSMDIAPYEIKGVLFEPEALGRPGMPLAEAKKKTTIEKQRKEYEKAKDPVLKQAQAAILATMLYLKSKDEKNEDAQKALYAEARTVLRDAITAAGDKADEINLRMLGSYELLFEDFAGAEKAWAGLVTKAPKDKDLVTNKAWWAYSLLRQYKNADALAVVKDEAMSDKTPEFAYVTAWAKWRTGDETGAWQAILTAAKGWKDMPLREALDRDILLFAGRTNVAADDAIKQLMSLYNVKNANAEYELLAKLGLQSYQFAGRWADGVSALEKATKVIGDKIPANDRPVIRYQQADYTVRLDDPVSAAKYATQAVEALPTCGTKCSDKDKNTVVFSVYIMGKLFHVLYATAHDDRYYQPAHDLYQLAVPKLTMDDKARIEAQKEADLLERSFKSMRAGVGTHDKGAIGALLQRHAQEAQACYEHALASNPKLAGNVIVNLESDQSGAIKGVSTEPKAGLADSSLTAGCIAERAKSWKLPKRAQAGNTRIKLTYAMSPAPKK